MKNVWFFIVFFYGVELKLWKNSWDEKKTMAHEVQVSSFWVCENKKNDFKLIISLNYDLFFFIFQVLWGVVLVKFFPRVWNFRNREPPQKTWFLNIVFFHCFFLGCGIIFFHFFSFWTWKILNFLMPEPSKFLGCRIKNRAASRIFSNANTIIKK